jgi:hypothetical protein
MIKNVTMCLIEMNNFLMIILDQKRKIFQKSSYVTFLHFKKIWQILEGNCQHKKYQ